MIPDLKTRLPVDGIAILFLLDVSGSMNTPDFDASDTPPLTRLDAAKQTYQLFISGGDRGDLHFVGRSDDQLGLIVFAAVPEMVCPLTLNHDVLLKVLAGQQPKSGLDAGTNIGDAIGLALASFQQMEQNGDARRKLIVLLSDGEHNKEGNGTLLPRPAAVLASRLQVPIHTIDCGGEDNTGSPDEQKQRGAGRSALAEVAETTKGHSFTANNFERLHTVFAEIDRLEKQPARSPLYRRSVPLAPWCGLSAVLLLFALGVLEQTAWRRLP